MGEDRLFKDKLEDGWPRTDHLKQMNVEDEQQIGEESGEHSSKSTLRDSLAFYYLVWKQQW